MINNNLFSVCHLLRSGVAALFGPQSGTTSSHVQSICDAMEIPHIETRWDYRLKRDDYSVNLYPHPTAISKVRSYHKINRPSQCYQFYGCNLQTARENFLWKNCFQFFLSCHPNGMDLKFICIKAHISIYNKWCAGIVTNKSCKVSVFRCYSSVLRGWTSQSLASG